MLHLFLVEGRHCYILCCGGMNGYGVLIRYSVPVCRYIVRLTAGYNKHVSRNKLLVSLLNVK